MSNAFSFNGVDGNAIASKVKGLVQAAMAKRNQMAQEGLDVYEYLTATPDAAKAYAGIMEKAGWEVDQNTIAGGMGSITYAMIQVNLATGEKRRSRRHPARYSLGALRHQDGRPAAERAGQTGGARARSLRVPDV